MALSYPELVWRQAAPGLWQRGIDEIEEFYSTMVVIYEATGRMFFGITGHLSLEIDVPDHGSQEDAEQRVDTALRKAWLVLRHNHPTIAARVTQHDETQEGVKTYQTLQDDTDRDNWLKETFVVLSTGETGVDWANSDPPAPKYPTCFVLRQPSTTKKGDALVVRRDLVLRSPHDIIDGIGTLMLFSNLVAHASEAYATGDEYSVPVFGLSEAVNLSPSYRIAANVPPKLGKDQEERLAAIVAQKAAAAMVVRDLQQGPPQPKRVRNINYILRNERSHCAAPFNSTKHPAALYHSVSGNSLIVDMTLPRAGDEPSWQERNDEFHAVLDSCPS